MLDSYLDFLAWPSTKYSVSLAIGVSAATVYWSFKRDRRLVLVLSLGGPLVVFLLLLLSSLSISATLPTWWQTVSIWLGWIAGVIGMFAAENIVVGIIAGFLIRYAFEWVLGPFVIIPFIKYVLGYGVSMIAPAAAAVLWGFGLGALLDSRNRAPWAIVSFVCCGLAAGVFLASPVLAQESRSLFADALQALVPCVLLIVVLGTQPRLSTLIYSTLFLLLWVGFLLRSTYIENALSANDVSLWLLQAPAVWVLSLALLGALGLRVYLLLAPRRQDAGDVSLWAVVMPWITLVPAWYFFQLGLWPFLAFMTANLVAGVILISGFAFPFARLDFASAVAAWRASTAQRKKSGASSGRDHVAAMRLLSATLVLAVAIVSYVVPWQWFGTVSPPPVVAQSVGDPPIQDPPIKEPEPQDQTGQGPTVPPTPPVPMERLVLFTSDPAGAQVVLDGQFMGVTPVTVSVILDGRSHAATFVLDGYDNETQRFQVAQGPSAQRVNASLMPSGGPLPPPPLVQEPGFLAVNAAYSVELRVQGTPFAASPRHLISLPPGRYQVEIAAPQVFLNETRTVEVTPGRTLELPVPSAVTLRVVCTVPLCTLSSINGRPAVLSSDGYVILAEGESRFEFVRQGGRLQCSQVVRATSRFLFADPNNQQCAVRE